MNSEKREEIARICNGLAHPIRIRIYELLEEKGEMSSGEIFREIQDEYEISSHQTVLNHIITMEAAGIVEQKKIKNRKHIKLKKKVKIEIEDIS